MEESALRAGQTGMIEGVGGSQDVPCLEDLIAEFREMLPDKCGTARAIDRKDPWEQIALQAVEDGYIEFAEQFSGFMEVCLRKAT